MKITHIVSSVVFFVLAAIPLLASAQHKPTPAATFGVRAGANMMTVSGIQDILIPEKYYSGYTFPQEHSIAPSASLFFAYRVPLTPVGLEARISYDHLKGGGTYSDIKGFTYTIETSYHMIGASAIVKAYPYAGAYLGAGVGYGWNLTPDRLSYSSNAEVMDWGGSFVPSDAETESELSQALRGNGLVYVPFGVGYDFEFGLTLEFQYRLGLNDVITTRSNRHNFGEAVTKASSFGLTAGWALPFEIQGEGRRKR